MNNRVRYTRQNIISNSFYQLPKFLFDAELLDMSDTAKVLYSILRNRHELSIKNEWFDENGEVFLYFKREDMQSIMKRSDKAVTRAMNELKELGLLEEVRQGVMKPNKIYLLSAMVEAFGIETPETLENTMTRTMYDTRPGDSTTHDSYNVRPNHNKEIHKDININPVKSSQSEAPDGQDATDDSTIQRYTDFIKNGIDYEGFSIAKPADLPLIDELIAIILDTVLTDDKTVRIGQENKPRALVKGNLLKLNHDDIEFVLEQYKHQSSRITKKKQYLLTMLYNAKMEIDAHYTNRVNSDIWNGGGC